MKLANWFEIDELEYCQYVLQGYEIIADENWVTWRLDGERHRVDGPAIIWRDGGQSWFLNGAGPLKPVDNKQNRVNIVYK